MANVYLLIPTSLFALLGLGFAVFYSRSAGKVLENEMKNMKDKINDLWEKEFK